MSVDATLTLPDGTKQPVSFSDDFNNLPFDQQQGLIRRTIAQAVALHAAPSGDNGPSTFDVDGALKAGHSMSDIANAMAATSGFDIAKARQAGYSDADIVGELRNGPPSQSSAPPDTGYGSALRYGAAGAAAGLGATAADIGSIMARNGLPETGADVQSAGNALKGAGQSIAPTNYAPAGPAVVQAIKDGRYTAAAGNLLRAGVEGAPDLAATLASSVVGPAGPAAYLAARNLGPTADARAGNNGETEASTGDVLGALPSTAAQAAIGTLGLGKFGPGRMLADAAPAFLRPVARTAEEAVAGAANDAAAQLGGSVGTTRGTQFSPEEAAIAAAQAGAARGLSEAKGIAADAVGGAVNAAQARAQAPIDNPVVAASVERINREMDAARDAATPRNGAPPPDTVVANNVKSTLAANLTALAAQSRPMLDPAQMTFLRTAIDQAQRHNNDLMSGGDGYRTVFDNIGDLPLPSAVKAGLTNGLVDLNTISTQSFQNAQQGPFRTAGAFVGRVAPLIHGAATGNAMEAAIGAVTGAGSHGLGARIGGGIGGTVDSLLGTAVPPITLQRVRAQQALKAAGVGDVGPLSTQRLAELVSDGSDPNSALYQQLHLPNPATAAQPTGPWTGTALSRAQWLTAQRAVESAGQTKEKVAVDLANGTGTAPQGAPLGLQRLAAAARARTVVAEQQAQQSAQMTADRADADTMNHQFDQQARTAARAQALVAKAQAVSTNLNERAADRVSGMAYRALAAREARNNGIVGAAATGVGPSPAYKASGGEFGAPGGNAPIIKAATAGTRALRRAQAATQAQATGGPASGSPGAPAVALPANGQTSPTTKPGSQAGHVQAPVRPAGFGESPDAGSGFTSGWKAYVHRGLKDHGVSATAADINAAVQHTVANGSLAKVLGLDADDGAVGVVAGQLAKHGGELRGQQGLDVINLVAAQVAKNKGETGNLDAHRGSRAAPGSVPTGDDRGVSAGTAATGRPPVRDPLRWMAAREDRKDHAGSIEATERAAGNATLADKVRSVAAMPTAALKTKLVNDYLSGLPKGEARDHARRVLADPILRKGVE